METIASLPTGTKLILAAGGLLFFDLFFTWQSIEQKFNKKFTFTQNLDAWDAWGLLLGLLLLGVLTLTVVRSTSLELSPEVPWNGVVLALGGLIFAVALVKNLFDEESAIASYVGVVLAATVAVGAYLDRDRPEPVRSERPYHDEWTPRVRPRPSEPQQNGRRARQAPTEPQAAHPDPARQAPAESAKRW
jgi:hypothetical protein